MNRAEHPSRFSERPCRVFLMLVGLGLLASASAASAAESDDSLSERFLFGAKPFITAGPHVVLQRVRASLNSDFTAPDGTTRIVVDQRDKNTLTSMAFQFKGGVQGPAIEQWPGKPRITLFASAIIPLNESGVIGSSIENIQVGGPNDILTQQTKLSIEYQNSAGAGLEAEFTIPIPGADVEITLAPGIEYLAYRSRYVGELSFELPDLTNTGPVSGGLRDKKRLTQHLLGPTLRFGTQSYGVSIFEVDFFLKAGLLFDVSGTRRRLRVPTFDNSAVGNLNFETGSSSGEVTAGLRIRLK